jgi:lipopolysaccharide transport system ATP-binding protein
MGSPIISVEGLSKCYRIGAREEGYKTFRETVVDSLKAPVRNFRRLRKLTQFKGNETNESGQSLSSDLIWALREVSFEVAEGEVLGVIGRNGAGKSTLLKILSRITEPTAGDVKLYGRVSSLLEVGTGFHPELTGRENIFLNGAIMGMRKVEIANKFDEIVSFAEIDKFIDTPVKRYSSGMYVRLAFAVAAHLEPEILIIDEVLAVGDAQFQKKCLGKMQEVGKEGRTVLFVSHNMQAIQALCEKVVLLNEGKVARQGNTELVVYEYLTSKQFLPGDGLETLDKIWDSPNEAPGNENVKISRVRIIPDLDAFEGLITIKVPLRIEFYYSLSVPIESYVFAMHFRNISGELIFISGSTHENVKPGKYKSIGHIPGEFLNSGIYSIELYFVKNISNVLFNIADLMVFEVHDVERESGWLGEFPGAVRPKLQWEFEPVVGKGL